MIWWCHALSLEIDPDFGIALSESISVAENFLLVKAEQVEMRWNNWTCVGFLECFIREETGASVRNNADDGRSEATI